MRLPDPPAGSAPMMRWWWFGPSVDRAEIDRELTVMAGAGLGGVEVAYVYPLGPDSEEFVSPEFLADLRYAADAAHELGLRFDLTLGSGWSFGGPHITAEHAARKLHWERREISPGSARIPVVAPGPETNWSRRIWGRDRCRNRPRSSASYRSSTDRSRSRTAPAPARCCSPTRGSPART